MIPNLARSFLGDPVLAPFRMIPRDALDEADVFPWDAGPADLGRVRLAAPQQLEASAVPADNRGRFHDDERAGPARPESTEGDPKDAVPDLGFNVLVSPLVDGELPA